MSAFQLDTAASLPKLKGARSDTVGPSVGEASSLASNPPVGGVGLKNIANSVGLYNFILLIVIGAGTKWAHAGYRISNLEVPNPIVVVVVQC